MATISSNLQMTLPESFDKVDVDILSDNFQKIDDFAGEAITKEKVANNLTTTEEGKALDARQGKVLYDKIEKAATTATYSATLTAAGWSASAPYTQTASAAGVLSTDDPFVDVDMSGASGSAQGTALTEAWGFVGRVTAGNGQITAYCYEDKPAVNLPVILKVVR